MKFDYYPDAFLNFVEKIKKNRVCLITQPRSGSNLLEHLIRIKSPNIGRVAFIHFYQVPEFFYLLDRIQLEDMKTDKKSIKYVCLTRKDVLRRAISHVKTDETRQFVSLEKPQGQPSYNFKKILTDILTHEAGVETAKAYFNVHQIEPLWITYTDLITNTDQTLMKVFSFCDFESERTVTLADSELKKLANFETEEWIERFKKDYADYREKLNARFGQNI